MTVAKQKRDVSAIRELANLAAAGDERAKEQFAEAVRAPRSNGYCGPTAGRPSASIEAAIERWRSA